MGFPGCREDRDVRVVDPDARSGEDQEPLDPSALARRSDNPGSEIIEGGGRPSASAVLVRVGEIGLPWDSPNVSKLSDMRREQEAARVWG